MKYVKAIAVILLFVILILYWDIIKGAVFSLINDDSDTVTYSDNAVYVRTVNGIVKSKNDASELRVLFLDETATVKVDLDFYNSIEEGDNIRLRVYESEDGKTKYEAVR